MKRLTALSLAVILALSLAACGGETGPGEAAGASQEADGAGHKVGDTVETEYYQFTLKDAVFTRNILVCYGEDASQAAYTKAEEFFTPSKEPFVDENGYVLDGVHGFSVGADSDDVYLHFDLEVQFTGTEERTSGDYDFAPVVSYGEYTFEGPYMSFYREIGDGFSWWNFGADFDSISLVRALGLEIGYFNGKFEPLSDPIEIRGYIQLPGEVETDTESPLSIRFAGEEFVLR